MARIEQLDARRLLAGVSIPIANPSFESQTFVEGAFTTGAVTDWVKSGIETGLSGVFNPTAVHFSGQQTTEGLNAAFVSNAAFSQILAEAPAPNFEYTLTVDVGDRSDTISPGYTIELLSGSNVLASTNNVEFPLLDGTFVKTTFRYVSSATVPSAPFEVRLISAGWQTIFDNVHLSKTPVAGAIPIDNPSFESQGLLESAFTTGAVTGWTKTGPDIGVTGVANLGTSQYTAAAATDGDNIAFLSNSTLSQTLNTQLQPSTSYELSVDVGDPLDRSFLNYEIALYAGGNLLASTSDLEFPTSNGEFASTLLEFVSPGVVAPGQSLEVRLSSTGAFSSGYQVHFDNVRLTAKDLVGAVPIVQNDESYYTPVNVDLVAGSGGVPSLVANDTVPEQLPTVPVIIAYPGNGALLDFESDGSFVYRPKPGFVGVDSFTYRTMMGDLQSEVATVSIAVGTRLLPRQNEDSNVFNAWNADPWLMTSVLDPASPSAGLGKSGSNIPNGSSQGTNGGLAMTGGLQLIEDVAPNTELVYRSDSLIKPILAVHTQLAPGAAIPTALSARLIFNGVAGVPKSYDATQLTADQGLRIVLQADGSSLPTGMYDYTIEVTTTVGGVLETESFTGKQAIVNRSGSEFGAGWGLDGLDRLVDGASGALVIRGNGDTLWFPKIGSIYQHAHGDTSYGRLVKNSNATYTLTSKVGIQSDFSPLGLLTSRSDANSNAIAFAYADKTGDGIAAELVSITDPFGRVIDFQYTGSRVSSIVHYSNKTTTLAYDTNSNLVGYTLTDPDGVGSQLSPVIVFHFGVQDEISRINAVGETTTYSFDSLDSRLRSVSYENGDVWALVPAETVGLNPIGNGVARPSEYQAKVTDQRSNLWLFRTDRFGGITESKTPLDNVRTTLRNADGLAYKITEPDPDGAGLLLAPVTSLGYSGAADLTFVADAVGAITRLNYSPKLHRLTGSLDPAGRTSTSKYDVYGNLTSLIDGEGNATTFVVTSRGLVQSMLGPDPDGSGPGIAPLTQFQFDSLGRVTTTIHPDGATSTTTYNTANQITNFTDELGNTTFIAHDDLGRVTSTTNAALATTLYVYDALSRAVSTVDPLQNQTSFNYDNRDRVDQITFPDPDGTGPLVSPVNTIQFDATGNILSESDPGGNYTGTIAYGYDSENRPTSIGHSVGNKTEELHYDNIGRLESRTRVLTSCGSTEPNATLPTHELYAEYDAVGRVTRQVSRRIGTTGIGDILFEERFEYNQAGELVKRIDGENNAYDFIYDDRGMLLQEVLPDPDGSGPQFPLTIRYQYDNLGRLTEVDRGFDRITNYEYNARNWPVAVIQPDPDGSGPQQRPTTTATYNARGDQTSTTDPLGRTTLFAFDAIQRLVQITENDPDGSGPLLSPVSTMNYNLNNWLISATDAVGATMVSTYDNLGRLTATTSPDPDGPGILTSPVTQYVYQAEGLHKAIDPLGRTTEYALDARGRQIAVTDPAGATTTFQYDYYDNLCSSTSADPDGVGPQVAPHVDYFYDQSNRLKEAKVAIGSGAFSTTTFSYFNNSLLESVDDGSGNTTSYLYDVLDRVIAETNELGHSRIYTYDVAGNMTRQVDRNGRVTNFSYDGLDRLTTERWSSNPGVASAGVSTVSQGQIVNEQQTLGWTASLTQSLSGTFRLTHSQYSTPPLPWDADAATIQSALEALPSIGAGNVLVNVVEVGAFGREFHLTFVGNLAGTNVMQVNMLTTFQSAPVATLWPSVQTVANGDVINEKQKIDLQLAGWNLDSGHWYVEFVGQVSEPIDPYVTPVQLESILLAFDGIDSVSVSGALGHFDVVFDGVHAGQDMPRLNVDVAGIAFVAPSDHSITTQYNAASEVVSISEPIGGGNTRDISYSRDGLGRTTQITSTYDAWNLSTFVLDQEYDATGNRTRLAAQLDATLDFENTYSYDKLRRLVNVSQVGQTGATWVTPKSAAFSYNSAGQRTSLERFEGTSSVATTTYSYDTAGRLDLLAHASGATNLNTYDHDYDLLSRLTSIDSTADGITSFEYDRRSQLTAADHANITDEAYSYDNTGNRTGTNFTTVAENRTTQIPGGSYTYDDEGNVIAANDGQQFWIYQWDHRNRLVEAQVSGSIQKTVEYEYDAYNRLYSRTEGSGKTYWAYDGGINPVMEFDTVAGPRKTYLWSNAVDELLAAEQFPAPSSSTDILWPLADHQGTLRDIASHNPATAQTQIVNHRVYDTFGNLISETDPTVGLDFGYTGKYFDDLTGLQNNLHRWYDPKLGKWISQDPIGFGGGDANLYRYVGNFSTGATDPDGMQEKTSEWYEARIKHLFEAPQQSWSEYFNGDLAFNRKLESSYQELVEMADGDPNLLQHIVLFGWTSRTRFSRTLSLKLMRENARMLAIQEEISEEEAERRLLSRSREITGSYNYGSEMVTASHEGGQRVGPQVAMAIFLRVQQRAAAPPVAPEIVPPARTVKGIKAAGSFDDTVKSLDDARAAVQKALPDAVELPVAVAGKPYPSPPPGVKKWFQVHPAEPGVGNNLPHIKYVDWTTGKKGTGGSWGHIFFPE